jgi:membrane protein implicated in regulation of membrane protease activity
LIKIFIMEQTSAWWILVALTVGAEMLTGTLYLLLIAAGMLVGGVLSMLGFALPIQMACAAAVAGSLVVGWMAFRQHRRRHRGSTAPLSTHGGLDVGHTVHVDRWSDDACTSVRYRGANWQAVPASLDAVLTTGAHEVIGLRGNTLVIQTIGK